MDARLRIGLRALLILAVVLGGLVAGKAYAGSSRPKATCPPSLSSPGAVSSSCAGAVDTRRDLVLTLTGGFLAAVVAIPASWPITRRRGERFWAD